MLVKNWMSKTLHVIDVDDSFQDAVEKMRKNRIKMLPVLEKGKLVGIVTDRDLKRASASDATTLEIHELLYLISKIKVKSIMSGNPITVPPDFTMEETAGVLMANKISGAPVVDYDGEVKGVITKTDLFKLFISISGFGERGIQLACRLEDRPGSIKDVTDIIREHGCRLTSILTSYENAPEGYRNVYIRIYSIHRPTLGRLLSVVKEKCQLLYMVDHREGKREIYE